MLTEASVDPEGVPGSSLANNGSLRTIQAMEGTRLKTTRLAALGVMVVMVAMVSTGSLALGGCSSNEEQPSVVEQVDITPESLLGLMESEAQTQAQAAGWNVRVVSRDGEEMMTTRDYRDDRLNFSVDNGVVVEVTVG